ncbi:glycosyltransferase [Halomonas elongata]|uniref:glycosyltransferase n=1 Tax=Halomonas elongata TaxID=2746 RepID=UPI0038D39FFB
MVKIVDEINRRIEQNRIAILIRFSHVSYSNNPFRAARGKSFDELAREIFHEERLRERFYLFEKYCLPSLDGQVDRDFCVILRCSTLLPDRWKQRLIEIAGERDYIYINFLSPDESIYKSEIDVLDSLLTEAKGPVITSRIDDDDALASGYVTSVKKYLHERFKGFAVSYSSGFYVAEKDSVENEEGKSYKIPSVRHVNNSCGLAFVGGRYMLDRHINNLKVNHLFIDKKFPTIIDSRKPMFMMSAHENQDTNRKTNKAFESCEWLSPHDISDEIKINFPRVVF